MEELMLSLNNRLIVTTESELKAIVKSVLSEMGLLCPVEAVDTKQPDLIPRRAVQRVLRGKGYRVSSEAAFIKFVSQHKLERVKRGHEYWYSSKEINLFPDKF